MTDCAASHVWEPEGEETMTTMTTIMTMMMMITCQRYKTTRGKAPATAYNCLLLLHCRVLVIHIRFRLHQHLNCLARLGQLVPDVHMFVTFRTCSPSRDFNITSRPSRCFNGSPRRWSWPSWGFHDCHGWKGQTVRLFPLWKWRENMDMIWILYGYYMDTNHMTKNNIWIYRV